MAKIGASGRIKEATLSRIIDMGGDESVLRLVHQDGAWYLTSEKAFQDTFELTVVTVDIDGGHEKNYNFIITDDPLNQGVTANTYFITPTGSYTSATAESGQTLTASIALTNSNTETGSNAYVRVDITMDPSVQKKGYWPNDGQQASIVIQNLNGDPTVINYTYHENGGHPYILYEVPAGATAVAKLNFATPNGITPDGTKVTLTPSIANSDGSYATPASNDKVSAPAVGAWEAEFGWDDIDKRVSAEQVHLTKDNKLTDWLKYDFTANTQNAGDTGEIWTNGVLLTDTLTLPEGMTFKNGSYSVQPASTGYNLVDGSGNIVFGLSKLGGLDIQSVNIQLASDRKSLTYTIDARNPKCTGSTVTAEMDNINYQAELDLGALEMTSEFVEGLSDTNIPAIKNSVNVTETSIFNQTETSKDEVQTVVKGNDGYTVHKTSDKENNPVVKPGDQITYTVTLTNTGNTAFTAENKLEDVLPQAVELDTNSITVSIGGNVVQYSGISYDSGSRRLTCPAQGLDANQTLTVTYTVTVKDVTQLQYMPSGSTIDNTATYRDARSYTSYTLEKGHYTVEKAVSGTAGSDKAHAVADGGQVTYTLKATADKGDVSPVIMEDTLPPYLKLLYVTAPNGTPITDLDAYRQNANWNDSRLWDHSNGDYLKVKIGDKDAFVNVNNGYVTIRYVRNETLSNGSSDTFTYTVQFDASKADDAATEGYVYYDNTVTTPIGETDHADFYGKFGELGVDKQIVSASKDDVPAIGPYENETVLTYSVTVTNNTENPYTKPTFTVTDELPAGLFPVVDNESYKTKAALDAALEGGTNVFTINERQVNIVKNGGGYKLTWTISNNPRISSITLRYPAQIDTTDVTLNAAGYAALVNTVKVPGASDQEIAEVKEPGLEMNKVATSIVNGKGSIIDDRHVLIQKGSQVTYTLTLKNPTAKDIVATNVYDYFPVWLNNGSLQQSNNYWSTSNVSVYGDFEGHHAGGNTMSINNNRVEFGSVRVPAHTTTLTETVTLIFPTNIELYQALLVQEGSNSLNRFHVDGLDDAVVDHTMDNDQKFYLQKGVVRFDKRVDGSGNINHDQQSYTSVNSSRDIYRRDDVNEVTYYVVLANTGGTNLHVDEFVDYLPDSLELLNTIKDPSQNFNTQEGHCTTTNAFSNCFVYDNGVLEQNNTTDWLDEEGINHQGNQGIPLTWDKTTGKITFNLNNGKGVTIAPKHTVMFYFRCKIKDEYINRTDIDAITNSVQAVLDGEPDIKRTSIKENLGAGYSAIQNNGGCTIVEREGGKTVAESSVTIHPMDAVVPGIQKTAKQYWEFESNEKGYKTDAVALRADHNQNIKSQSKVEWEIVLRNDGTEDMTHGYTVTDYIPVGHRIAKKDVKGQSDNVFVTSYVIYDQNNTAQQTIPVTDDVFTGASIEGTSTTGYKATFTFTGDAKYRIPAGGYAVMKLVSDFIEGWDYQGRIDNEAAFYPNGDWNANLVRNGELIKNDDGTAYTGVKASDYVNAFGEMATSSNKKVEEVEDASNSAYGYEAKNNITVPHGTKRVKYTLQVTDLAESAIDRLVMIDRLPEMGDTGVNNLNNQRGSEFSIGLPSNLVVKVKGPGDYVTEHTLVNGTHYKVQYSTKVAFDDEDYNASFTNDIGTGWSDTPFTGAKSFRILFDKTAIHRDFGNSDPAFNDGDLIVPKNGGQVKVEFEAPIGEDANPGETAYNSFGYRYYTMNSSSTYLQAEPTKVGVRIEPQPALQKRVLDENDQNMGGDATNLFQFSIYAWPTTGELATKSETQLQEALANKMPEQVTALLGEPVFTAEVPQGGSVNLPRQVREDGTARIIFEDGKKYIVVEQAKPGYYSDGYEIGGLKKSQANVAVFTYSVTENTVVVAVNKEDVSGFTPMAYKALVTRDSAALTADRFSFRLQEYTDDTYTTTKGEPLTATNAADGKVEFAKIDYTEASTHYYRMSEVVGNETGIIYDQTMYNVVVVVTEKGAGRFGAVPTYYKVTGEQTTPEALAEGQVPQFVNTESTEIQVEKVWAGEVTTGSATMVLYRSSTEPTATFDVTINANLDGVTPAASGAITVTYTGDGGDTGTITLNNAQGWTGRTVPLKRGEVYSFAFAGDAGNKVTGISPASVIGVHDAQTINLRATVTPAAEYSYTFTVPVESRPTIGSINVTFNSENRTLNTSNGWTTVFTIVEDSTYTYSVVSGCEYISGVTDNSGSGTANGNSTIEITPTVGSLTMDVPVSVNWGSTSPDAGTTVTVTFTPNGGGTAETTTLSDGSWSTTKTLDRVDSDGNLITWTVSAVCSADNATLSGVPASVRESGTVALTGTVARGMTLVISKGTNTSSYQTTLFTYNNDPNAQEYEKKQEPSTTYNLSSSPVTINNLDITNSGTGSPMYYGLTIGDIYVEGSGTPYKVAVTTDATNFGKDSAYGDFVWIKAQPGTVHVYIDVSSGETHTIQSGTISALPHPTFTASLPTTFLRIADGGANDVQMRGVARTFADTSTQVSGSGTPFTVIQAKDLPVDAVVASDITGYEQTISGADSYTWENLPLFDDEGHRIYYYVVEKTASANASEMSVRYGYTYNTANDAKSGISVVTVTNTTTAPPKGDLRITKAVTVDGNSTSTNLADGTYNFTITGLENYNHTASITVTGGVATSTIDLTDLTLGDYTITETGSTDGHAMLSGCTYTGTGYNSGDNAIILTVTANSTTSNTIAAFTNNVNTGTATIHDSVTVNKTDGTSALNGAKFALYTDAQCTGTPIKTYDLTSASSFAISTNDNYLARYLPANSGGTTTLYLKEIEAPANHRLDSTVYTVTITKSVSGPTWDAAKNKYITTTTYDIKVDNDDAKSIPNTPIGSIKVTKLVKVDGQDSAELGNKTITIGLFKSDTEPADNATPIQKAQLTLSGASTTATLFSNLEMGTYYVYELDDSDHPVKNGGTVELSGTVYTVTEETPNVTLATAGQTGTVTITNSRTTQTMHDSISVTKKDQNGNPVPGATFTLYNDEKTTSITTFTTTNEENGNTFTIETGDDYLANYLPAENGDTTTLYLKETTVPTGYQGDATEWHPVKITKTVSTSGSETTTAYTITIDNKEAIDVVNTALGSLSIIKKVPEGVDASDKTFTFQVKLTPATGVTIDPNALTVTGGMKGTVTPETPSAGGPVTMTLTITGAATATITGIPVGTTYEVTETNLPTGWYQAGEVEYSDQSADSTATPTINAGDTDEVTITNTKGISIQVTKQWKVGDNDKTFTGSKSIEFTLYQKLTNAADPTDKKEAVYTGVTGHADGKFTITYTANTGWEIVNIPNLPRTVTETKTTGEGDNAVSTPVTYNASYYVVEDPVPSADAGYVLVTTYSTQGSGTSAVSSGQDAAVNTNGATITIINTETAGVELPATGGTGTLPYTLTGLTLLLGASLILYYRRRRREQN